METKALMNQLLSIQNEVIKQAQMDYDGTWAVHYTSPVAMTHILKNSQLQFTHYEYLNDFSEGKTAGKIVDDCLSKMINDNNEFANALFKHLKNSTRDDLYTNEMRKYNILTFVCSCSMQDDDLNMWRYYTKNENCAGYAIEFNPQILFDYDVLKKHLGFDTELKIFPVVYDPKKQIQIVNYFLTATEHLWNILDEEGKKYLLRFFDTYVMTFFSAAFKEKSFESEHEIRFCCFASENEDHLLGKGQVLIREFRGFLMPCILVDFNPQAITKIIVSPTSNFDFAKKALEFIRLRYGYNYQIEQSKILIRY